MSKKISFCALMSVFGILCVFVANILTTNTIFLLLLSTLFTYISTEEYGIKYGLLTFAVITLVSYFIYANKITVGLYAVMVGYYPVIKHMVEHMNISMALKWFVKVLVIFIIALVSYWVFKQFVALKLPVVLIFVAGVAVFVIYDIFLTMGIKFYALKLRKFR